MRAKTFRTPHPYWLGEGYPPNWLLIAGIATRSAPIRPSRPSSGVIVAPTDVRNGLPGSGPQTLKSKLGTPSAERSMPKTSQITPNSKIARPSSTSADTLFNAMAAFYRKVSFLPLLAGYLLAEYYCHDHCTQSPRPDRPVRGGSGAQLGRPSL